MFSSMDSELETHFWIWSHFQPNLYVWLKEESESFHLQNTSWQQLNVNTDEILQMLNLRLWPEVFLTCLAVVFWGFFCKKCKKRESGSGGRPLLVSPLAPVPPEVWRQCNMSSSSAALSPWAPSVTSRLVFQEITAQTQSDSVIWYVPRPGGNELSNLSSLSAESQNPLAHSGVLVDLNIARRGQINGQSDRVSPTDLSSSYLRRRRISS